MVDSRFVHNGGVRLHYLDTGPGTDPAGRPPVVFVPGMTDVAEDYSELLPLFGRRAVVVELRGHGRSDAPATGYDLASLRSDVGAVIDAVTDGPVHVVTFSRGTSYALAWAIAHPGRVRSVSIGDYTPEERALPQPLAQRLLDGRWRGTPVADRLDRRAAEATFAAARSRSLWDELARLSVPLLVVRSGERVLITDEEWKRYHRTFPDAWLVEFPDSPHDIFRPDRSRYPLLVREHIDVADKLT